MVKSRLQDVNGKESGKRYWAGLYLSFGLIMPVVWFILKLSSSFYGFEFDFEFPLNMWYGVVGFGAAVLGVTIFEVKNK